MKNKKTHKIKNLLVALLVIVCFGLAKVNAQCSYGAIMVVCHSDPGFNNHTCCGWLPLLGCGSFYSNGEIYGSPGTDGRDIKNPSIGMGPTCAGGSSATGVGDAFAGTCGWSDSGSTCGTPWGPTPGTGTYTAYPCVGTCGG
jgi:hypothetical protein